MLQYLRGASLAIWLVSVLLIFGGVGSIIFGIYPWFGSFLILLGAFASVWSFLSSEFYNRERDAQIETQALLLARAKVGNTYLETFWIEMRRTGSCKNALARLQKALEIDPTNSEVLALLVSCCALQLANKHWLGGTTDARKMADEVSFINALAKKGLEISPDKAEFYDAMGILFDLAGNYEQARECYEKSGSLRSDPYWRLLLSTSWGMAGDSARALEQMELAVQESAAGWLVDFYLGRALVHNGRYAEGLEYLKKAYRVRGGPQELLCSLQDAYYWQGFMWKSAKYEMLLAFRLLVMGRRQFLPRLAMSLLHFLVGGASKLSKALWPHFQKAPKLSALLCRTIPPDEPEASLGLIMAQRRHYAAAVEQFRKALQVNPKNIVSWLNLAACLAKIRKKEQSLQAWENAQALEPKNPVVESVRSSIVQ